MEDENKILQAAERVIEESIIKSLAAADETIAKGEWKTVEELRAVLEDANSLISFVCAENEELYERWRYRLIQTEQGKLLIVQGLEIDVDVRRRKGDDKLIDSDRG